MDMRGIPFWKMHGLGNDFVIIDARTRALDLPPVTVQRLADRRLGVGCDQLITLEPPRTPGATLFMGIRNADGGIVESCGNASRCVAALAMAETGQTRVVLDTLAGPVTAEATADGLIAVDMGPARLAWSDLPLAEPLDTLRLPLAVGPLQDPCAVSVGNPHAVFLVEDAADPVLDLATWGPAVEHHPLFPNRTNVEVIHRSGPDRLRMRVWERGVGITRACGTGACAAFVAARRRGLIDQGEAWVDLDGGALRIAWGGEPGDPIRMTGPATLVFTGTLTGEEGA